MINAPGGSSNIARMATGWPCNLTRDSVLGPRELPHAWAFVGDTPGKLLIAFAPANKMEDFFRSFKPRGGTYSNWNDPQDRERMRAYNIDLLGPPLSVE